MANPNAKPPKEFMFKKGSPGNPCGRPKLSPELLKIKALTKDEVGKIFAKYVRMSKEELLQAIANPTLPAFELWICSGIANGIKHGDWYNMNLMFDRLWGKVKPAEDIQLPDRNEENTKVVIMLPSNGKEARADVIEAETIKT